MGKTYPTLAKAIKNSTSSGGPWGGINQLKKPLSPKNNKAIPNIYSDYIFYFFHDYNFFPVAYLYDLTTIDFNISSSF